MADDDNDAVYTFSPHDLHHDHAVMAAIAGKHVLIEPIARTIEEAQLMIECARSCGINLIVAENYRFIPALDKALEVMKAAAENGIGHLRSIMIICEGNMEPSEWRRSLRRTGGGVFIDGGIHFINLLLTLGGFPERISATWYPRFLRVRKVRTESTYWRDVPKELPVRSCSHEPRTYLRQGST